MGRQSSQADISIERKWGILGVAKMTRAQCASLAKGRRVGDRGADKLHEVAGPKDEAAGGQGAQFCG